MGKPQKDLKGLKFGRLEVIQRDLKTYTSTPKKIRWICHCECGTEKSIRGENLYMGKVSSCGCLQKEIARETGKAFALPDGENQKRSILQSYKKRAKGLDLPFELSKEEFEKLLASDCSYCGSGPSNKRRRTGKSDEIFDYNGVDRISSDKGYTMDNVVPCCSICNYAKNDLPVEEFLAWAERVSIHQKNKTN